MSDWKLQKSCLFFNTRKGCKNGDLCPYSHTLISTPKSSIPCKWFATGKKCFYGEGCYFSHVDTQDTKQKVCTYGYKCAFLRMGKCRYEHNGEEVKLVQKVPGKETTIEEAKKKATNPRNRNEMNLASKKPDNPSSSVHNLLQVGLKPGDENKFAHIFQQIFGRHDEKEVKEIAQVFLSKSTLRDPSTCIFTHIQPLLIKLLCEDLTFFKDKKRSFRNNKTLRKILSDDKPAVACIGIFFMFVLVGFGRSEGWSGYWLESLD